MRTLRVWWAGPSARWVKCGGLAVMLVLLAHFLTGCASRISTATVRSVAAEASGMRVIIPPSVEEKCGAAALPEVVDLKGLSAFGIRQTGALEVCERKRALAVETMRAFNSQAYKLTEDLRPRPWWQFWKPH